MGWLEDAGEEVAKKVEPKAPLLLEHLRAYSRPLPVDPFADQSRHPLTCAADLGDDATEMLEAVKKRQDAGERLQSLLEEIAEIAAGVFAPMAWEKLK